MGQQQGIMFVIDSLWPGGAEHVLLNLVQGLCSERKYRPVVACLHDAGPLAKDFVEKGIPVHPELLKDRYDVAAISRLMKLIKAYRVRVVVAVGSGGNRMFWGTLAGKLAGVKVVVWSHTFSQPGHPEFEMINHVLYPLVDRFIALGKRHKACMANRDKVPEGRIAIIPNGIPLERYERPQWRDRARSILGLADENIVAVGMIGNLRPSKRHDVFISAAKEVVKSRRDVHFFIVGDGPNRASVRTWAQDSDLLGRYLSIFGHRDDVPHLLPGFDVMCICSEYQECQSMVALQAMAAGVPVVSNIIGSMDEAIVDNHSGFFYPTLNSGVLANRLLEVIAQPELRMKVKSHSRTMVEKKFTTERMVRDFTRLFDDLLANSNRQTGSLALLSRCLSSRPS